MTSAQSFLENTYLVDIRAGEDLSQSIRKFRQGGYELSNGNYVSFSRWYKSNWRNLQITMMTQTSKEFGLLWGFGTGEVGEKYTIDPSLKIGFIWQSEVEENFRLSLSATTLIGGKLREKPCLANYGAIGGVQKVNCRLAASFLAPADTLNYLINESPEDQFVMRMGAVLSF
ncbi:hypothetical protein [Roseovarius sp.]|uniref:hypothetical protein n=1 Tax=Roseovarius sp. TaxID=1486281 RepID=UPI0025DDDD1A|nr:hypothetical protein [Roseovarius sp.]